MKELLIDFLFLDLDTCERCMATEDSLNDALGTLHGVFKVLDYKPIVNKVNITSKDLAEQYRFMSSPTIRVNGIDICGEVKESCCVDCSDLCGDDVDCRVFEYNGKEYDQPPAAMLVDGILRVLYGNTGITTDESEYSLPENLNSFFSGKAGAGCCSAGCDCTDDEQCC